MASGERSRRAGGTAGLGFFLGQKRQQQPPLRLGRLFSELLPEEEDVLPLDEQLHNAVLARLSKRRQPKVTESIGICPIADRNGNTRRRLMFHSRRRGPNRARYCPQFHIGPIGVCVQHGPKLPPFQRPR